MRTQNDSGSALVMSLLIVMALSIIGAAMTVLSLSETYGSMNYRLMSQARYGAESAVHKAANYIINTYQVPGSVGDPLNNYTTTVSPVTYNGAPVVLSAIGGISGNYPVGATQTAFQGAGAGSLVTGNANIQYASRARLLSMRPVFVYGTPAAQVIQTWEITGVGSTSGARVANVEVTATLERQTVPLYNYAIFATNPGCGALNFSGGAEVDSYDSQNIVMSGGNVVTQQYGGNIGSNGNLNESGGADIYGTMSTPRSGVGNCSSGGVTAWSVSGGATVSGGLVQLPQTVVYPTPPAPNPMPPTTTIGMTKNSSCAGISGCTVGGTPAGFLFAPGTYGNINLSGQAVLHLQAGTYNINSISLSGNSTVVVDSGPVVLNVAGQGQGTPVDFSGGALTNGSLNPALLQVQYGGTGTLRLSGGTDSSAMVYAPNASVHLSGGTHWFGAIVAATVNASGGMRVHNDRQLANNFLTVGNYMLSAFSWKKY